MISGCHSPIHSCVRCWKWVCDCLHCVEPLTIKRQPVKDVQIRSVGYDRRRGRLEIEFTWTDDNRPSCGSSGRGPDPRGASRDENPGLGPSGGHVQIDRGLRPSNPEKTPDHRDEAGPSKPPDTEVESNNLHATCNGFSPRTNNRLSTRTRE